MTRGEKRQRGGCVSGHSICSEWVRGIHALGKMVHWFHVMVCHWLEKEHLGTSFAYSEATGVRGKEPYKVIGS